jgi:hypothetical protein
MGQQARRERLAKKDIAGHSEVERAAILDAIALERGQIYWPITATFNLAFFFGLAAAIGGLASHENVLASTLAGILAGIIVAATICRAPIFAEIDNLQQLQDRQFFIGVWVKIAIALSGVALIVWAVRSVAS